MTDQPIKDSQRIVVGVDGSPGSKTALRWAMTQAQLTGATVEAVAGWQDPTTNGYSFGWVPEPFDGENQAALTQKTLDQAIAEVSNQFDTPVPVQTRVVEGHPAQILPEISADAQLLVVGSRGHGGFVGILLGSVSRHCVQHSSCPVVVVPKEP
jgi:nucleotide-binding universal stress UspA family protein